MKTKRIRMAMLALLPVTMITLVSCSSTPEPPPPVGSGWFIPNQGAVGGVRVQTVKLAGTVTAMDKAKRTATILAPDGITFTVTVKPEAVNFAQIKVGDPITATVVERIDESLATEGTAADAGAAAGAAETLQYTAKVIAIDLEKCTATLQFEDGEIKTVPIRNDVSLNQGMVGRQVIFHVTDRTAIWIEKQE